MFFGARPVDWNAGLLAIWYPSDALLGSSLAFHDNIILAVGYPFQAKKSLARTLSSYKPKTPLATTTMHPGILLPLYSVARRFKLSSTKDGDTTEVLGPVHFNVETTNQLHGSIESPRFCTIRYHYRTSLRTSQRQTIQHDRLGSIICSSWITWVMPSIDPSIDKSNQWHRHQNRSFQQIHKFTNLVNDQISLALWWEYRVEAYPIDNLRRL